MFSYFEKQVSPPLVTAVLGIFTVLIGVFFCFGCGDGKHPPIVKVIWSPSHSCASESVEVVRFLPSENSRFLAFTEQELPEIPDTNRRVLSRPETDRSNEVASEIGFTSGGNLSRKMLGFLFDSPDDSQAILLVFFCRNHEPEDSSMTKVIFQRGSAPFVLETNGPSTHGLGQNECEFSPDSFQIKWGSGEEPRSSSALVEIRFSGV